VIRVVFLLRGQGGEGHVLTVGLGMVKDKYWQ